MVSFRSSLIELPMSARKVVGLVELTRYGT